MEAMCKARGWEIGRVYRDVESGGNPGRQAYHDLMHDAKAGHIKVIVFWAWDRLSREGPEAAFTIMKEMARYGSLWESIQEPFLSSAADPTVRSLLLPIIAWVAEMEKKRISERTKAALAQRRALGVRLGRPPGTKDSYKRTRRNKRGLLEPLGGDGRE